ncbi:MAG: MmcQ/YjbR family DNA-binding protein [Deltaproteobacteria bacterium]|nr:MmcQ/YjbR family DNA-binding protein [Deltaproteobacteria bacterium]
MPKASTDPILRALRERGLRYPGAHLKSPWPGHLDLAVKDKTFAYLSLEGEPLGIGCKLPHSSAVALMLPFCQPTPYGLGKSGWVTAKLTDPEQIDVAMLEAWIDESYRAQAPKKLVKELDARSVAEPTKTTPAKKTPAKKTPAKKTPAKKTPTKKSAKKSA